MGTLKPLLCAVHNAESRYDACVWACVHARIIPMTKHDFFFSATKLVLYEAAHKHPPGADPGQFHLFCVS